MYSTVSDVDRQRAALLASALSEVVAELRLIEPGEIIGYISTGQWANIADLVQSSAELHFEEGALTFGGTADFSVDWATSPSISLDMEFQWHALSAFFTIFLDRYDGLIELKLVWYPNEPENANAGTAALAKAVRSARRGSSPTYSL